MGVVFVRRRILALMVNVSALQGQDAHWGNAVKMRVVMRMDAAIVQLGKRVLMGNVNKQQQER